MSKVLLTGATGFIGRACLDVLQKAHFEIHALHRHRSLIPGNNIIWHSCDILNAKAVSELIAEIQPDYLIHLAWIVDHKIFWSSEKNIDYIFASLHLYKEFSKYGGKKAVFLGTCAEYDRNHRFCDEDKTPLQPDTLYGICKKQTLELLNQLKLSNPNYADFSWVRIFNIYGPHEHQDRLIPYVFSSYLRGNAPVLNQPSAVRDYIYVANVAEILVHLLQCKTVPAMNIGSGLALSLAEISNKIHEQFFSELTLPEQPIMNSVKEDSLLPSLHYLTKLNIPITTTFKESLELTYHWWVRQINNHCET